MDDTVLVGLFSKTIGLKGFLSLISYTENPEQIFSYNPWLIVNSKTSGFSVIPDIMEYTLVPGSNNRYRIALKDCNHIDTAKELYVNKYIYIFRSSMPQLVNSYYYCDLINCSVYDINENRVGYVENVASAENVDLLYIKTLGDKLIIPFLKNKTILLVDILNKKIIVNADVLHYTQFQ